MLYDSIVDYIMLTYDLSICKLRERLRDVQIVGILAELGRAEVQRELVQLAYIHVYIYIYIYIERERERDR